MKKTRLKEIIGDLVNELSDMYDRYLDNDDFGDYITDLLTKEEAEELDLDGWFGEDDDTDLPDKVTLNEDVVEHFKYDDGDVDDVSLQECIDNYLSDEYGYCVNEYNYKCAYNENGKLVGIDIYNIDWDLDEEEEE